MKHLKYLLLIMVLVVFTTAVVNAQVARQFGARRIVLDNNDNIAANNISIIDVNGSLGIDNSGLASGTYPNTSSLMTLLAGSKTTNLRIDGGATWGIDVVNTNNSIRTSGSNIFGDGVGNDATTVNISGTGNLTLNGIAAPALPSPLSNLLYLNGSNQVQQTPGGVNIVTGSGSLNTVPLWTPTGFQLGNSILTQPTTSTMVITPAAGGTNVLTVNNFNNTSTALKINANGGTGINVDPASTGISIQATNTGINFASAPTTGIVLQALNTGIKENALASTAFGMSVDMTTNPVSTLGASVYFGQITGTSGTNVFGGNINAFSNNASCTGFGCTTNVNGTGNTNGVFASASSNGNGTVNGVLGSATGTGAATGILNGGIFSATGGASSAQIDGISATATGVNNSTTFGGAFSANGSTFANIGVSASVTSGAGGQNVAVDATASGANSVGVRTGAFSTPNTGIQVLSANATGVSIAGAPTAVSITSGNLILGSTVNTIATGNTIPNGQAIVDVNDNGNGATPATVVLPAAPTNGQVVYITTEDPQGVKITVGLSSVTISNAEVGRFMFINGTWRLEH